MTWAIVDNKEVKEIKNSVPRNTNKISGFWRLSEEDKKAYGWYKVKPDTTKIESWQIVSTSEIKYDLKKDEAIETKTISDMSLDEFKDKKYNQLRNQAKAYIFKNYPDYKQLSALAGFYDDVENKRIKDGVKYYFDIATKMKTDLYAMATYEEVDSVYFMQEIYDDDGLYVIDTKFWGEK